MRKAFVKTLIELAEKDERIYLLTGDLGYKALEEFSQKFPKRFINCGVAEQNMMGVAAGLALCGKKPYVYSIVPFVTLRCLEQIRNDVCYQNLDVKIIGIGGGFSYGTLGSTHSVLEEVAILRALPNMAVLCPADLLSTEELIIKSHQTTCPTYTRTSKLDGREVYKEKPNLTIGRANILKNGKDGAVVATGLLLSSCLQIAEELKKENLNLAVLDFHTLKPIEKDYFLNQIKNYKKIFTVEEHSVIGGAGSAVAEILAESDWQGSFKIIGVPDEFPKEIGDADYLRKKYLIDTEEIKNRIIKEYK
jgi:transketolase